MLFSLIALIAAAFLIWKSLKFNDFAEKSELYRRKSCLKKIKANGHIGLKSVCLVYGYNVHIHFEHGELGVFNLTGALRANDLSGTWRQGNERPNKPVLIFNNTEIKYREYPAIDSEYIYINCKIINELDYKRAPIYLGILNNAPTKQHNERHDFFAGFYPMSHDSLFFLGESFGHGFGESGGQHNYSLQELLELSDWKEQFQASGCSWVCKIIEANAKDEEKLRNELSILYFKREP